MVEFKVIEINEDMGKCEDTCKICNRTTKEYKELVKFLEGCCSIDCKVKYKIQQDKQKLQLEYDELPYEKKQEFLDLFWDGNSIGEAKDKVGLSLDLACKIINENLESVSVLRREAK